VKAGEERTWQGRNGSLYVSEEVAMCDVLESHGCENFKELEAGLSLPTCACGTLLITRGLTYSNPLGYK